MCIKVSSRSQLDVLERRQNCLKLVLRRVVLRGRMSVASLRCRGRREHFRAPAHVALAQGGEEHRRDRGALAARARHSLPPLAEGIHRQSSVGSAAARDAHGVAQVDPGSPSAPEIRRRREGGHSTDGHGEGVYWYPMEAPMEAEKTRRS